MSAQSAIKLLTTKGCNVPGGTTSKKVKSLIPKELAIFLLVPIAHSHYNSHYLNIYKSP